MTDIPPEIMAEALEIARRVTVLHGAYLTRPAEQIARAILAAELRGRQKQREEDAAIAANASRQWVNGEATTVYGQGYQHALAHIAHAIRDQK